MLNNMGIGQITRTAFLPENAFPIFNNQDTAGGVEMRLCSVEGCDRKHFGKGFCNKHYGHNRKYGKVLDKSRLSKNEFEVVGDTCVIKLAGNHCEPRGETIIDLEDKNRVLSFGKWCNGGYARCTVKNKQYGLHRIVLGITDPEIHIDHIDRNKLNNRKNNLRIATRVENKVNMKIPVNNTSGYKGVSLTKYGNYKAQINKNKKAYYLGFFNSKISAALAYNEAARQHHGEFACLNKVVIPINEVFHD